MGNAAVTDVAITCATNAYSIGGTVVGLSGLGLVLQDNAGDNLPISSNGAFTLQTSQQSGASFAVTIASQPSSPTQVCSVIGGTGSVGGSNVGSVTVNCATQSYTVAGTASGLNGTGLILQDNAGDNLPISGNGTFAFPTPLASGSPYAVTVNAQPTSPWQTCTVSAGSGSISNASVTTVAVSCSNNAYAISVNVNGLAGTGFSLIDNGSDVLAVTGNGISSFAQPVSSGGAYSVAVQSQPSSPSQTCVVASGSGATSGSTIPLNVNCTTNSYTVGGNVTGLTGTGLVLQDNGGNNLSIPASGGFTFSNAIASGASYVVSVLTQPSAPRADLFDHLRHGHHGGGEHQQRAGQ